jgi:hypothetical protein
MRRNKFKKCPQRKNHNIRGVGAIGSIQEKGNPSRPLDLEKVWEGYLGIPSDFVTSANLGAKIREGSNPKALKS